MKLRGPKRQKQNKTRNLKSPNRQLNWKVYNAGFNLSSSQCYRCGECPRLHTFSPTQHGHSEETRLLAIRILTHANGGQKENLTTLRTLLRLQTIGKLTFPQVFLSLD